MLSAASHHLHNTSLRHPHGEQAPVAVIIEDDPDTRELITLILGRSGFRCHAAADGLKGVEAVRRYRPDLIIVNAGLPGIDGFEVNRRLRGFSAARILMISAWCRNEDRRRGLEAGADDYLTKPFHPADLSSKALALTSSAGQRSVPRPSGARQESPRMVVRQLVYAPDHPAGDDRQ